MVWSGWNLILSGKVLNVRYISIMNNFTTGYLWDIKGFSLGFIIHSKSKDYFKIKHYMYIFIHVCMHFVSQSGRIGIPREWEFFWKSTKSKMLLCAIFVMPIQTVGHELVLYPESIGRHAVVSLEDDSDPVSLGSERLWYRRAALFTDRGRADHTTVQYVYVIKVTPGVVLQRKILKGHLEYKHITLF